MTDDCDDGIGLLSTQSSNSQHQVLVVSAFLACKKYNDFAAKKQMRYRSEEPRSYDLATRG